MPVAAVVPPSVPASPAVAVGASVSAKLLPPGAVPSPGRRTCRRECRWGRSLLRSPRPTPSPTGTPTGRQHARVGVLFDEHVVGQPAGLARRAPRRFDRPTVHAGYWPIIASVSESTSKHDQQPRRNRQRRLDNPVQPPSDRPWRAPRRVRRSGTTPRAAAPAPTARASMVVKPKCHSGNAFDHGTPKFETYHQPLTLANDSAITNSTSGREHGAVAPRAHHRRGDRDGGQRAQRSGQPGEHAEVVRPLGRREHHRQERDDR